MKTSTLINSTLASLILLTITATATQAQTQRGLSTYAAKFVCGKAEKLASPGQYFTMINVHNASPLKKTAYVKRFAIALPEEKPGKISEIAGGVLAPDEAMTIDCDNIYRHTQVPPGEFLEGFALIYAISDLDVVSVYTAGHSEVESIHTERVPLRKLVLGRTHALAQRLRREESQ